MKPLCCLLYCRPGFEKETSAEIMQLAQQAGLQGYIKAVPESGFSRFYATPEVELTTLDSALRFEDMIFARQSVLVMSHIQELPVEDRITPILAVLDGWDMCFNQLWLETPDTNQGKQLSSFCKKFSTPLTKALEQHELIDTHSPWRLHLFFIDSSEVMLGLSHIENSAAHPMGIMRLKMPKMAPSRSTLKLEEAFRSMLSGPEQQAYLHNGMTAVDLGACPGGWTWQLVQRGIRVNAIDNGPMDPALMEGGLVKHIRADGFKYTPQTPVDWLVCDMVERPLHIARLIARWICEGHCQHAAFNLKLPMKKRYDMVQECLVLIEHELNTLDRPYLIKARHLYHDREEITCIILRLKPNK